MINVGESSFLYVSLDAVVFFFEIREPLVVLAGLSVYVIKYRILCLCAIKLVGIVRKQRVKVSDLIVCRCLYCHIRLCTQFSVVFLAVLAVVC